VLVVVCIKKLLLGECDACRILEYVYHYM
jgi:hypothetical protein